VNRHKKHVGGVASSSYSRHLLLMLLIKQL